MKKPHTVFVTYLFSNRDDISSNDAPYQANKTLGYSTPIHCNYIQRIETDDITNKTINLLFPDETKFPFMKGYDNMVDGQGWSATNLYALINLVPQTGTTVTYDPAKFKIVNVTNQITNYNDFIGFAIPPANLANSLFNITLTQINSAPFYTLDYLSYPTNLETDRLAFGEEVFFYGNVKTDVEAQIYTTDITINLPNNQYNYTTNPTWDGQSPVYISEIGIYDDQNNLVAIGKLNYPISKDSTRSRSFSINIDF